MIRKIAFLSLLLCFTVVLKAEPTTEPTTAPTSQPVAIAVSDGDALTAAADKEVVVTGKVSSAKWSGSGKVMVIRFADAQTSGFTAVLFSKNKDAFDAAFGGDVKSFLKGATVSVHGTIKMWAAKEDAEKKPELILNTVDDLKVLSKPTPSSAPTSAPAEERQ